LKSLPVEYLQVASIKALILIIEQLFRSGIYARFREMFRDGEERETL
jgi:hypothetical protein